MITFNIKELTPVSNPTILENGDIVQKYVIQVKINGIVSDDKIVSEVVDFMVPNSIMAQSPTPLITGQNYINNVLVPQWIENNFSEI